jgi:hypothetical protein
MTLSISRRRWTVAARILLLSPITVVVSGCGGGGGSSSTDTGGGGSSFTLSSKSDVAREIANAVALLQDLSPGSDPNNPNPLVPAENPAFTAGKAARPKSVANCTGGGTEDAEDESGSRPFLYFPVTLDVTATRATDANCTQSFQDGTTQTFNGVLEEGSGTDSASGNEYDYAIGGTTSADYVAAVISGSGAGQITDTFHVQGLLERALESDRNVVIMRGLLFGRDEHDANGTVSYRVTLGNAAAQSPSGNFQIQDFGTGDLTLDGPLTYSSNANGCPGGAIELTTLQPLHPSTTDDPTTLVSGVLQIAGASTSVTATFNSDGSVTIQYANNQTDTLSANDLSQAEAQQICRNAN